MSYFFKDDEVELKPFDTDVEVMSWLNTVFGTDRTQMIDADISKYRFIGYDFTKDAEDSYPHIIQPFGESFAERKAFEDGLMNAMVDGHMSAENLYSLTVPAAESDLVLTDDVYDDAIDTLDKIESELLNHDVTIVFGVICPTYDNLSLQILCCDMNDME